MAPMRSSPSASSNKASPLDGLDATSFIDAATEEDVTVTISWGGEDGAKKEFKAKAKKFGTGSFGWNASGKLNIPLELAEEGDARQLPVSLSCNLTVTGSKPKGAAAAKSRTKSKKKAEDGEDGPGADSSDGEEPEEEAPPKKKAKTVGNKVAK